MITVHEIHSAPAGELSSLRSRIESDYSSGVITDNNAQNHIWREFNRRCFFSGNQSLMLVPFYDGFRPVNLDVDRIVLIDGTGDIQLIDESGFIIPLTYSTSDATFGSSSYMFSSTESSFDIAGTLRQGNGFAFGDIEELDGATEFTLAFWIKKELTSDDFRIGSVVNSSNNAVLFDWDATVLNIKIAGSGNIGTITRTGVDNRDWTHFAIVYNGAETGSNKTKLYINGDLITSSAGPDSLPTGVFSDFSIGAVRSNNQTLLSDGKASDVRLFSKALSESEIDSIYNYENISSGLIGHWISDNNDTLDYSSNHNSAIKYNNPIFVNGGPLNDLPTFGHNSIRLLGDNPSPFVGSQNKILNGTETELTLAFWIKRSLTANPAGYSIFAIREATNNQTFLTWDFRDFIIFGARNASPYFYSDLEANTSTGWNHLAVTVDTTRSPSDTRARCFLNGQFLVSMSADDTISDGYLMLGLNHSSLPSNTDGEGDYADCRVYNRALSDTEIENIYNGELIENGLIHWIATDDQDIEDKISGITMISSGEVFITNGGPFS